MLWRTRLVLALAVLGNACGPSPGAGDTTQDAGGSEDSGESDVSSGEVTTGDGDGDGDEGGELDPIEIDCLDVETMSWGPPELVAQETTAQYALSPRLALSPAGSVHAAWPDPVQIESIRWSSRAAGDATWTPSEFLATLPFELPDWQMRGGADGTLHFALRHWTHGFRSHRLEPEADAWTDEAFIDDADPIAELFDLAPQRDGGAQVLYLDADADADADATLRWRSSPVDSHAWTEATQLGADASSIADFRLAVDGHARAVAAWTYTEAPAIPALRLAHHENAWSTSAPYLLLDHAGVSLRSLASDVRGRMALALVDEAQAEVMVLMQADFESGFSLPVSLRVASPGTEIGPTHVVPLGETSGLALWHERADPQQPWTVYTSHLGDEGWTAPVARLDTYGPAAAGVDACGHAHVVAQRADELDLVALRFDDGSFVWSEPQILAEAYTATDAPRLVVAENGRAAAGWSAETSPSEREVRVSRLRP